MGFILSVYIQNEGFLFHDEPHRDLCKNQQVETKQIQTKTLRVTLIGKTASLPANPSGTGWYRVEITIHDHSHFHKGCAGSAVQAFTSCPLV